MNKHPELDMQQEFFRKFYAEFHEDDMSVLVMPTGNFMGERRWQSFKESGYIKGTLDVTITHPRARFVGLTFDFKSKNGKPSDDQLKSARKQLANGFFVFFPKSVGLALSVCREYLSLKPGDRLCDATLEVGEKWK